MASWNETPEEAHANLNDEIRELEQALTDGLRADAREATERQLARLRKLKEDGRWA